MGGFPAVMSPELISKYDFLAKVALAPSPERH
jgi:hypothetical protein